MINVDEEFLYVTNSLRRMDVMYVLGAVDFARNYEIADILCMRTSHVSTITKDLQDHGLVESVKSKNYKVYSLTEKGRNLFKQLREYHGIE